MTAPSIEMKTHYTVSTTRARANGEPLYAPYSTNGNHAHDTMTLAQAQRWAFHNGNFQEGTNHLVVLAREVTRTVYPITENEVSARVVTDTSGWRIVPDAAPQHFTEGETWLVAPRNGGEPVQLVLREDPIYGGIVWDEVDYPISRVSGKDYSRFFNTDGREVPQPYTDADFQQRANSDQDDYALTPQAVRVYEEDHGDEYPWCIDGVDSDARYTEDMRRFSTLEEVLDFIPEFITECHGVTWAGE